MYSHKLWMKSNRFIKFLKMFCYLNRQKVIFSLLIFVYLITSEIFFVKNLVVCFKVQITDFFPFPFYGCVILLMVFFFLIYVRFYILRLSNVIKSVIFVLNIRLFFTFACL